MQMCLDHMRTLSLCLVCIVGLACSSSNNEGETCGTIAGIHCADDEYCDYTNNKCGIADGSGTCKPRPEACTDIYSPVCACDGKVYGNECDAAVHGFDVSANGQCE
jgi:hypothetical protein